MLTFTDNTDPADSSLLALNVGSSATGVAVEIMDASQHRRQPLNKKYQRVTVDDEGNAMLSFTAPRIRNNLQLVMLVNFSSYFLFRQPAILGA